MPTQQNALPDPSLSLKPGNQIMSTSGAKGFPSHWTSQHRRGY
jgi:hypothetical protein